jgi:type VI secretion system protein ImpE
MHARELFQAGRLDEAIESLGVELRRDPTDAQRRAFLFELLAFAGNHDRAARQLDVLGATNAQAGIGALTYKAALQADRLRTEMFTTGALPSGPAPAPVSGTLNGQPFSSLEDADPRVGARLEVFAGGEYLWLPLEHVATLRMERPARLRDLLWAPARLITGPTFRGLELGEVLLPVLTPLAALHADPEVRLGRKTVWEELPDGRAVPAGQRLLLVDGEEVPVLEVRELVVTPTAG